MSHTTKFTRRDALKSAASRRPPSSCPAGSLERVPRRKKSPWPRSESDGKAAAISATFWATAIAACWPSPTFDSDHLKEAAGRVKQEV